MEDWGAPEGCYERRAKKREEKNVTVMGLDAVSHFFDIYRQNGKNGEEILQSLRENISRSIKRSALGTKEYTVAL